MADERFFRVKVRGTRLSRIGWTALETQVMKEHRWWTRSEISKTSETVYPEDLILLMDGKG